MRHIVYVIITSFFITNSYALELSHITLNSKFNEPLKAQIKVSSIPKNSISNLKAQLASTSNFNRAGIKPVAFLETLEFAIENTSETSANINITSKEIVKERVLNFLIQLNWRGGRILREYALLLDLPLYKKKKDNFYTVTKDDSLWKIADKTRRKGKTVRQQMLNIFNTNKQAFAREDMSLLKVGARLKIASLTENIPIAPETAEVKQKPVIMPVDSSPRLHIIAPKYDEKLINQINKLIEKNTSIESENGYLKQELSKNNELLAAMKKQLDDMNKMIVLQNKQLSELQTQLNQQVETNKRLQPQQKDTTKEWLNSPLAWLSIGAMILLLLLIFFIIKIFRSSDNEPNYVAKLVANDAKNEEFNDYDDDLSTGITDELEKYLKGESALSLEQELSDALSVEEEKDEDEDDEEELLSLSEECYFLDFDNNYPVELAPEKNEISLDKLLVLEGKLIEDEELFLKKVGDDMLDELSLADESTSLSLDEIYTKELAC
ncbi:type IV pilus assembly protein FimV [Candidatus Marithrix sp. Canyon 246]|uniref:type IV pilus assembly protein FimV n=1 Tax=Candidatus Marithrix sp. Canyon 246 TaxID=1827136 RepID=UPI00084A2C19|nr:hypothetical protein [Candidatus Marithrix sp. Canyon 246]